MTTVEALTQCLRNTRVKDLSNATGDDALCLVRALNEAVQDVFSLAPDNHKRTTFSHYLDDPETVSGIYLSTGETVVSSGTPFTTAQRGCTIVLAGDPTHNEVVSTTAVLKPYLGSESTPFTGSLYYDAVPITDFAIERITSHPRVTTINQQERTLLQVSPETHYHQPGSVHGDEWWWAQSTSDGLPRYYRVHYVGGSIQNENDALVILRVAPRPSEAMTITFEADVRPAAFAVTCLHDAKEIPISRTAANHLLPLIEAHLVGTPIWTGGPMATQRALNREQEARRLCMNMTDSFVRSVRRAGTTKGW